MGKPSLGPLTDSQREIMEIVWELGTATVSDVHKVIAQRRDVARNTVQTLMVRLAERGWLKHKPDGRSFIYSAAQPREKSLGELAAQMVDFLFGGSPLQMVNALMEYRGLSESELQSIREMIAKAESAANEERQVGTKNSEKPGGASPVKGTTNRRAKHSRKRGPKS